MVIRTPDLRINVFMARSQVQIAIDLSGESLHRRSYRESGNPAPLKENLAAAMLMRGEWPALATAVGGFVDPMAGSGTLAIEAAWIVGDVAPTHCTGSRPAVIDSTSYSSTRRAFRTRKKCLHRWISSATTPA